MNHKNVFLYVAIVSFLYVLSIYAINPLDVLGLDENATDREIKKKCYELLVKEHPDKTNGLSDEAVIITGACDNLDWRKIDDCRINNKRKYESCKCTTGNIESFCRNGFTTNSIRCDCPLSDGTRQDDFVNQLKSTVHDECDNDFSNHGQSCTCQDTGKKGTCGYDGKCSCEYSSFQQTRTPDFSSFYEAFKSVYSQPEPTIEPDPIKDYYVPIFSPNITAVIYNIPLQRVMTPPSECSGSWFTLIPFMQTNSFAISAPSLDNFTVKNIEGGLGVGCAYYGNYWYLRDVLIFGHNKTTTHYDSDNFLVNHETQFELLDDIIALGFKTASINEKNWQLSGEGFFGVSQQRIKGFKVLDDKRLPLFNYPSMGTGAQVNFEYVWSEDYDRMNQLSALSRFTYFIPVKGDLHAQLMVYTQLGSIHYSPGSFLDLFFAFKHFWGDDLRHHYEVGYNPTIHVMNESVKIVHDYDKAILHACTESIPPVSNTFYATYTYTRIDGGAPLSLSIGATVTVASHVNPFGTVFGTFAIRI